MRASEVRANRKALGLTQTGLAEALGLPNRKGHARRTISDWEAGRRVVPGPAALAIAHLVQTQEGPKP